MRLFKRLTLAGIVCSFWVHLGFAQSIHLINNQPFPIRLPVEVRDFSLPAKSSMQPDGSNLVLIADLQALSTRTLNLEQGEIRTAARTVSIEPTVNGITISQGETRSGTLSWDILVEPAP